MMSVLCVCNRGQVSDRMTRVSKPPLCKMAWSTDLSVLDAQHYVSRSGREVERDHCHARNRKHGEHGANVATGHLERTVELGPLEAVPEIRVQEQHGDEAHLENGKLDQGVIPGVHCRLGTGDGWSRL